MTVITAPQHQPDLDSLDDDGVVIEGVRYSPLKIIHLSSGYDDATPVFCEVCDWTTTVGDLPTSDHGGTIQPDVCPDCAKDGDLGFVRKKTLGSNRMKR